MLDKDDEIQPDPTDLQPNDQDTDDKNEPDDEEFEPKISPKEFGKKLRGLSAEAKKLRKENQRLKAENDAKAKEQLKEQGKYKEMYERSQGDLTKLQGALSSRVRSSAFRQEAVKQGCDAEMIDLLEGKANLGEIEVDDKWSVDRDQVVFEVEQLKSKYPKLFQKEARPPKDGAPKKPDTTPKTFADEAKAAKTQAELDLVMKKYGMT